MASIMFLAIQDPPLGSGHYGMCTCVYICVAHTTARVYLLSKYNYYGLLLYSIEIIVLHTCPVYYAQYYNG